MTSAAQIDMIIYMLDPGWEYDENGLPIKKLKPLITIDDARELLGFPRLPIDNKE